MSRSGLLSRWSVPGTRTLAQLAFSLYLTHKAVVHVVRLLLPGWTQAQDLRAAAIYAVSCLAAAGGALWSRGAAVSGAAGSAWQTTRCIVY